MKTLSTSFALVWFGNSRNRLVVVRDPNANFSAGAPASGPPVFEKLALVHHSGLKACHRDLGVRHHSTMAVRHTWLCSRRTDSKVGYQSCVSRRKNFREQIRIAVGSVLFV